VKKKKLLEVTLTTLTALLLLLILVVLSWLGPTVKVIAEGIGSKALGVPVTVNSLDINPREGTLLLEGFSIGNHPGYVRSNTVSLTKLAVSIDMSSLFSDTIVVPEILIDSPHIVFEQQKTTDNIEQFITNVFAFAKFDPNRPRKPKPEPDEKTEPKQVVVERLRISDVKMTLAHSEDPLLDLDIGLEELNFSLTNGVLQLRNLTVSNPGRLDVPDVFTLETINLKLDPASIYAGTVIIQEIQVIRPYAYLEHNTETDTAAEFLKIANYQADKPAKKTKRPRLSDPAAKTEPGPPPVELQNLLVDDVQIKLLDITQTNRPANLYSMASIGRISIKPVEGDLRIESIVIPNTDAGFSSTNLLQLARIGITLDPASLYSDQVIIKDVWVDSPLINLEQTETTGNITELQKILMGFIPPAPESTGAGRQKSAPIPLAEQPVILETLRVADLTINMITPAETNSLPGLAQLSSLNPLNMLAVDTFNPMHVLGGTNASEEVEGGPLTLLSFDLLTAEPLNGTVAITNLQVGNPKGFAHKNIVQLNQLQLDIDPDTLQADIMLIEEILIENLSVAYERKLTTDNIKELKSFITNVTTQRKENADEAQASVVLLDDAAEPAHKIIIGHLLVKSGLVKAKLSALPSAPIPLPKIEMNDIGQETGGTSIRAASAEIGKTFYDTMIGSISSTTGFGIDALKGTGALAMGTDGKPLPEITDTPPLTVPVKSAAPPKRKNRRRPGRPF
jgi:hypothetical protein